MDAARNPNITLDYLKDSPLIDIKPLSTIELVSGLFIVSVCVIGFAYIGVKLDLDF